MKSLKSFLFVTLLGLNLSAATHIQSSIFMVLDTPSKIVPVIQQVEALGKVQHSQSVLTGFLFHFASVEGEQVQYNFAKHFDVNSQESCWIHVYLTVKNKNTLVSSDAKIECYPKNED